MNVFICSGLVRVAAEDELDPSLSVKVTLGKSFSKNPLIVMKSVE
jgi:hypothetical protein